MSGYSTAQDRARIVRDCLLKHGVPEVSIELQAGRPTSYDEWNACKPVAVMSHHIASYPTPSKPTPGLSLVKKGRSDLPGPLCNGTAGVDLVYRVICLGYANHPGYGGPLTVSGPMGSFRIPEDNGRPYIWGTEYEGGYDDATWNKTYTNKRTGKSMTFREFMGRCNAGLVEAIWLINGMGKKPSSTADLSGYHMEHKTWAPDRKVDRRGYTTASGRAELKKYASTKPLKKVSLANVQKAAKGQVKVPLGSVKLVQRTLNQRYGSTIQVDGSWGPYTTKVYKKHQTKIGNDPKYCDGIPGKNDLTDLGSGVFIPS